MIRVTQILFVLFLLTGHVSIAHAAEGAPWGKAKSVPDLQYQPGKVIYDFTSGDPEQLATMLDRLGYLYKFYAADPLYSSIVVIIHGEAIPFFAVRNLNKHRGLMVHARSMTAGTSIEFRMCAAAAKVMGYKPEHIHGFVQMVPMADAEIIRLQQEEDYAYLRWNTQVVK